MYQPKSLYVLAHIRSEPIIRSYASYYLHSSDRLGLRSFLLIIFQHFPVLSHKFNAHLTRKPTLKAYRETIDAPSNPSCKEEGYTDPESDDECVCAHYYLM